MVDTRPSPASAFFGGYAPGAIHVNAEGTTINVVRALVYTNCACNDVYVIMRLRVGYAG